MSGFGLQAEFYNSLTPADIEIMKLEDKLKLSKRPKGKWIYTKYHVWICSHCQKNPHSNTGYVPSKEQMAVQWKFCNLCGAEMEV